MGPIAVVLVVATPACRHEEATFASPTGTSTVTVTAVSIDGPRVVPTGSNVNYIASVGLSNGNTVRFARPIGWTIDNAEVATITSASDGFGELTALRPGVVMISAQTQGVTGRLQAEIRDNRPTGRGAQLVIVYDPNPVVAVQTPCPSGFDSGAPTWTFTETIAETQGVGFTQESVTFNLYSTQGQLLYTDTEFERYRFDARSAFVEPFCTSLFGEVSGYYADIFEGQDDDGNRVAFGGERLRLLPAAAGSMLSNRSWLGPIGPGHVNRRGRHRVQ
jgi:hypothetical protein